MANLHVTRLVPETIGKPCEHNTIMAEERKRIKYKKENVKKYAYAYEQNVGIGNIRKNKKFLESSPPRLL